jgi:hypothetical protein
MRVHYINVEQPDKAEKQPRATIGGSPILTADQEWPHCRLCKSPMVFYFQLDLLKAFELPLRSRSHMLVFMCPVHNDLPTEMVDNTDKHLPDQYWQKTFGHYAFILNGPKSDEKCCPREKVIVEKALSFVSEEEDVAWDGRIEHGTPGFKIGGVPRFRGEQANLECCCGGEMIFVCQVPAKFGFAKQSKAPVQPAAVATDEYNLFLGKETSIFACKNQCSPYALYAVTQSQDELAESA